MKKPKISFKRFSQLINLSREEWPLISRGLIFLTLSSVALLVYPGSIKTIIDEALISNDQSQLNRLAFFVLALFILQAFSSALRYYFFTLAGEKTVKRLRTRLFKKIVTQEMEFFDQQKTGELLGRLSSDTAIIQNALSVNISMLVRSFVQAGGAFVMLFITSAKLASFILILVPPIVFIAAHFGKKVKSISKTTQDTLAQSTSIAGEGISGIRTVKAFAQEDLEKKRYELMLEKSFLLSKSKIYEIAKFTNLVSLLGLIVIVFIIWYGGTLVLQKELTTGTLTSFILYVMTLSMSVGMLGSLWTDFMSAFGASDRIFEILEMPDSDLYNINGIERVEKGNVEFKDVYFSYPARKDISVINGLSFNIESNETVAIVGSSGGGKSTIVQLIMNFYPLSGGKILIDSQSIKDYSTNALRQSIGLVSQEPILISESISDNIKYSSPNATLEEIKTASKLAYAHDFITNFPNGYETLVGEKGIQLSGGQKQRVAIARAILKNPALLILDEATSALDSESESIVQKALDNIMKDRSTIIIAHRLSTIKKADRILVFENGNVLEQGTHEELYKNEKGLYRNLVEHQFEQQGSKNE
ncbi:ABC transporter transmembrane domain-containing protein [Bacteriovoracaceae bacterium]|nr:ABC transporter transmembrane domain-containing protein [Bacteriovoracaceae bacterium]